MIVHVLIVLFCRIDAKPCSFRFAGKKMAEKTAADSLDFCLRAVLHASFGR